MAKKWPEPIIEQSFKSNIRFQSVFSMANVKSMSQTLDLGTGPSALELCYI